MCLSVISRIMVTEDIRTLLLSPGICEYIASLGEREFADVAKVKNLVMDYPGGPNLVTGIFKSREYFPLVRETCDHRRMGRELQHFWL